MIEDMRHVTYFGIHLLSRSRYMENNTRKVTVVADMRLNLYNKTTAGSVGATTEQTSEHVRQKSRHSRGLISLITFYCKYFLHSENGMQIYK